MKTYFAWIEDQEVFDQQVHKREDEKIFHLEIKQKEGGFAQARVIIKNPGLGLLYNPSKRHCHLSFDNTHIFSGRLIGMPTQISGELISLLFTAAPNNTAEQQEELRQILINSPSHNKLFFSGHDENQSLSHILQSQTLLPYWCRKTGKLSLSHIFEGRESFDIADNHFYDSLQATVTQDPLDEVEVEIVTEWVQQSKGTCELSQSIKRQCKNGYISSLTNKSLEESWWKPDQKIANTVYRVKEASLIPVRHSLESNSAKTVPVWHLGDKPKQVQFRRYLYDLNLNIGWFYRQKRQEKAHFKLEQTVQNISGSGRRSKKVSFSLPHILGRNQLWKAEHHYTKGFKLLHEGQVYRCLRTHTSPQNFNPKQWLCLEQYTHVDGQSTRPTFFVTDTGRDCIAYALEVAKAYLAASARCITIKIKGDLRKLSILTTDHTLALKDPRLPGGQVSGKVISYNFVVDGLTGEKSAAVSIAVCVGNGRNIDKEYFNQPTYGEEGSLQMEADVSQSISGIKFRISPEQYPKTGLTRTGRLNEGDIVREIKIINSSEEQERKLIHNQYPKTGDIQEVLSDAPTDIQIKLLNLDTQECLSHNIEIDVLTTWSAPKQIDLSAPTNV